MSNSFAPAPRLEIGRVIQQTVSAIGANLPNIAIISLAVAVASNLVELLLVRLSTALDRGGFFGTVLAAMPNYVVSSCLNALLLTCVTVIVIEYLNGRQASLGQAIAPATRLIVPIVLLSLVVGLGVGFGALLLVVPGLILLTMWAVAVPARVVEAQGLGAALSRSSDLTRGYRWKVFLLGLIYGVLLVALTFLVGASLGGVANMAAQRAGFDPLALVAGILLSTITAPVSSTLAAVLYTELRRIKEGALPSQLAAVFD